MEFTGRDRIETQVELILPAELEACLAQRIVTILSSRMTLGQVRSMGRNLVSDHPILHVLLVGQTQVFLGSYVAEHRASEPTDHRSPDAAGNVIIARSDIRREWPEGVKRSFLAPLQLLGHVLFNHVHGDMTRAFVHHLHAMVPRSLGQFSLHLEFSKLCLVIGISNGSRPQAVANTEADIVGGHDFTNFVPVSVEEILAMVCQAPLGQDAASSADNAGHATGGHRDESQEHPGVNGEIVDTLFGLLDEGVPIDFPSQILGLAADLFQSLINGNGPDGHRGVSQDPLPGGVDVLARRKIHHRVGSPLGGPAHLLDLFLDAGGHGAVADVGVNLHQKISTNNHRLVLRVIDVRWDNGPSGGDFATDEFSGDLGRNPLGKSTENRR